MSTIIRSTLIGAATGAGIGLSLSMFLTEQSSSTRDIERTITLSQRGNLSSSSLECTSNLKEYYGAFAGCNSAMSFLTISKPWFWGNDTCQQYIVLTCATACATAFAPITLSAAGAVLGATLSLIVSVAGSIF